MRSGGYGGKVILFKTSHGILQVLRPWHMGSYTTDQKYGRCAHQREQPGSSNIAILWVFLIKQLFHLHLLDMR